MTQEEFLAEYATEVTSQSMTINGRERAVELICDDAIFSEAEIAWLGKWLKEGVDAVVRRKANNV